MANFCPAHTAEERFGVIRVDTASQAVGLLMIDPVHREPAVKLIPWPRFSWVQEALSSISTTLASKA